MAGLGVLWVRDLKITTDLPSQEVVDLAMAWDSRYFPRQTVDVYRMVAALAEENTSMRLKVPDEVAAFHSAAQNQRLTNNLSFSDGSFRQSAICPKDELDGFGQVGASLL